MDVWEKSPLDSPMMAFWLQLLCTSALQTGEVWGGLKIQRPMNCNDPMYDRSSSSSQRSLVQIHLVLQAVSGSHWSENYEIYIVPAGSTRVWTVTSDSSHFVRDSAKSHTTSGYYTAFFEMLWSWKASLLSFLHATHILMVYLKVLFSFWMCSRVGWRNISIQKHSNKG